MLNAVVDCNGYVKKQKANIQFAHFNEYFHRKPYSEIRNPFRIIIHNFYHSFMLKMYCGFVVNVI